MPGPRIVAATGPFAAASDGRTSAETSAIVSIDEVRIPTTTPKRAEGFLSGQALWPGLQMISQRWPSGSRK
jgi:hypothetical protein